MMVQDMLMHYDLLPWLTDGSSPSPATISRTRETSVTLADGTPGSTRGAITIRASDRKPRTMYRA